MTDRRKRITSFPLPFYHGYRKRYKCEKLPSWDTAKGGTRAAFCSGMYCKGVKRHAKYACRIGGEMVDNRTEVRLNVLQGLLHYHERMMAVGIRMQDPNGTETEVPIEKLYVYADALREAIRCVKLVNGRT